MQVGAKKEKRQCQHGVASVLLSLVVSAQASPSESLFDLPIEELAQVDVSVATGTPRSLFMAPSATSVITAEDLAATGAQHLDEALQTLPGVHVSHGGFGFQSRYYIRGIFSNSNPHTLVLVNGVPMTSLLFGDRLPGWGGVPVKAIERVEVVRGPGSAVHGADAMAGVINIITWNAETLDDTTAAASWGTFDTRRASLQHGQRWGETQAAIMLNYHATDGDNSLVEADWQSGLDDAFGTDASLAPGRLRRGREDFDVRLALRRGNWRLGGSWQQTLGLETGQGLFDALDPQGSHELRLGNLDLQWQEPYLSEDWGVEVALNGAYKAFVADEPAFILPPGTFGIFPDGWQEGFTTKEAHAHGGIAALYSGWSGHRIRLGSGYAWSDMYKVEDQRNFDPFTPGPVPGLPAPLPGLVDVSDTDGAFLREEQRTSWYLFAQDEWRLAPRWELVLGLRHDDYSDFGDTTNPRAALIWETTPTFTSKLLYGEAFRAPSFLELYANNVAGFGNEALDPEKLHSTELAFAWQVRSGLDLGLNLYHYHIDDFIEFVSDAGVIRANNVGKYKGAGAELEVRYHLTPTLDLAASADYGRMMVNRETGDERGQVPVYKGYLQARWRFMPSVQLTGELARFGHVNRESANPALDREDDPRSDLDAYTVFDVSLRARMSQTVTFTLAARNLFDRDVREPSNGPPPDLAVPRIPNDLPQPGRQVVAELSARW